MMKLIMTFIYLIITLPSLNVQAQWPGYFYTFVLKDAKGNIIDTSGHNYKMSTVKCNDSSEVLLSVEICTDNKTWRFYEGAVDYDKINKLKIERINNGNKIETMIVEFPLHYPEGKKSITEIYTLAKLNSEKEFTG